MTYEEVINNLKYAKFLVEADNEINEDDETVVDIKFIDIAIACIEKQIPKKVLPDDQYLEGMCPFCGVHFLDRSTNFCGNCGQAVDFSK